MKHPFFIYFVLLFPLGINSQLEIQLMPLPNNTRFEDMHFINDSTGYAVRGSYAEVVYTNDYGMSWQVKATLSGMLRAVEFIDEYTGFAGDLHGTIFRTTDGGNHWVNLDSLFPMGSEGVCGISISPDKKLIAAVGRYSGSAHLFRSTDHGQTWDYRLLFDSIPNVNNLVDVYFKDSLHGWISGNGDHLDTAGNFTNGGTIYYTDDGGDSWTNKYQGTNAFDRVWKIYPLNDTIMYGSIESGIEIGSRYLISKDGGMSWTEKLADTADYKIQMVGFLDTLHGYLGGYGPLLITTDGGNTWSTHPEYYGCNRFVKRHNELAYIAAYGGYRLVKSYVGTEEFPGTEAVAQLKLFPNPADDYINLSVLCHVTTPLECIIADASGKLVQYFTREGLSPGENIIPLSLEGWAPGIYTVHIQIDEGLWGGKFVVE